MNNLTTDIATILTVHDRVSYYKDAIQSVLEQMEGSDELIIISNVELDKNNMDSRISYFLSADETLGGKILKASNYTECGCIAFLEDDDIFLPGKLQHIREIFATNPQIGCYHNNYVTMLENGSKKDFRFLKRFSDFSLKKGVIRVLSEDVALDSLLEVFKSGGLYNLSCLSIKSELIKIIGTSLNSMNGGIDTLLPLIALENGYHFIQDSEIKTSIRIHKGNQSGIGNKSIYNVAKLKMISNSFKDTDNKLFLTSVIIPHLSLDNIVKSDRGLKSNEFFLFLRNLFTLFIRYKFLDLEMLAKLLTYKISTKLFFSILRFIRYE